MSRRAAAITQADVARALRAAKSTGSDWRVEIRPGGVIAILPHERTEAPPDAVATDRDDGSSIML